MAATQPQIPFNVKVVLCVTPLLSVKRLLSVTPSLSVKLLISATPSQCETFAQCEVFPAWEDFV